MFQGFANVWTIVGVAKDLKRGKLLPMEIAGDRLVFFRNEAGEPRALLDRCPHRGVALSLGALKDGCVECPFHGWRFSGDGANCHVPWNPDAKKQNLGVASFPVRELGGLLWLYTAPIQPPFEPQLPEVLQRKDVSVSGDEILWKAHWTRAMENMLDWPHLPFVHKTTIGRGMKGDRMDITWEDRDFGGHTQISIDDKPQPGGLDYRFPNAMELQIDPPGRTLRMIAVCLPVNDTTTKMLLITVRGFLRSRIFNPIFRLMNRKIATQDQAVLETSYPVEVPEPGEEKSVRTDAPTLKFRKIYRERLKGSVAAVSLPMQRSA